jgi:hypothetical protein
VDAHLVSTVNCDHIVNISWLVTFGIHLDLEPLALGLRLLLEPDEPLLLDHRWHIRVELVIALLSILSEEHHLLEEFLNLRGVAEDAVAKSLQLPLGIPILLVFGLILFQLFVHQRVLFAKVIVKIFQQGFDLLKFFVPSA